MSYDKDKFKALVLYVIWKTGDVRDFGSVKLNKVLWFSDARAFEALGKSITGETYVRRKYGPVPRHINEALQDLLEDGLIRSWSEPYFHFEITRFSAHQPADTNTFSPDELGLVDWWIKQVCEDHTATSISEKSHDYGWRIVQDGEELPYKAFLARRLRLPRSRRRDLDRLRGRAGP